MNVLDLAFNQHIGLQLTRHDDRNLVCLDPDARHTNHLETVHAGVLFSLAEAASGHALLEQCRFDLDELLVVLRSADVRYRRPATGRLIAFASIENDAITALVQQLAAKRRAFIDVPSRVRNANEEDVFTGTFRWYVSHLQES